MVLYFLLGDFGLSIVVLTSVISLLLLPLTLRQFRAVKVMRKLQPQVTAIRQQYATDRLAQAQAMQALHREHGIHPSSSFLTLLIQAPIYSGLYFALNTVLHASSVDVINRVMYPFLFHFTALPNIDLMWFTVLKASWHISLGIPDPTHLLPLLTGALTLSQMRMAQPTSLAETRDALMHLSQGMQFLLLFNPVGITIVIAWQFAAGLALYRFVSLALSMMVQYFTTGWDGDHFGRFQVLDMLAVLYHPHVSTSCRLPFLPGQEDVAGVARHVIVGRIQEKGDEEKPSCGNRLKRPGEIPKQMYFSVESLPKCASLDVNDSSFV
jgi:YidC/Oxa1 family membrane protein insertase